MKVGDYVGKVNNDWMKKNPSWQGTTISKELFGYEGPEPMGIIVATCGTGRDDWNPSVDVLKPDGTIERIGTALLEVIKS